MSQEILFQDFLRTAFLYQAPATESNLLDTIQIIKHDSRYSLTDDDETTNETTNNETIMISKNLISVNEEIEVRINDRFVDESTLSTYQLPQPAELGTFKDTAPEELLEISLSLVDNLGTGLSLPLSFQSDNDLLQL